MLLYFTKMCCGNFIYEKFKGLQAFEKQLIVSKNLENNICHV